MATGSATSWIQHLQLTPHIEGGYYSEVYRSATTLEKDSLPASFPGSRPASTHIYFLLEKGQFSAFHRIRSDELWHFYAGDPLIVYEIETNGTLQQHLLGNDPLAGQSPFCVVRAGNWFASKVGAVSNYALAGCTVAPGFDFEDFEMGILQELLAAYPQHHELLKELCR